MAIRDDIKLADWKEKTGKLKCKDKTTEPLIGIGTGNGTRNIRRGL